MNCAEACIPFRSSLKVFHLLLKLAVCLMSLMTTLILSSCHAKPKVATEQPVPVKVRTPNALRQPTSFAVSGSVEASVTAMTAFEVSGRVLKVYVDEGQHVTKGQLLAELDPTDYRHNYEAAQGTADAANAAERKARNGLRPEELEQAQVAYQRAQDELQRMKFLYDRKSLSANDYQKYEAAYQTAKQNFAMAQQGTRNEDRAAASAQVRTATAQMQDARTRLKRCRLVAPISGFIGMKHLNVGDSVAAGAPVLSVLDLEIAFVRVAIPESEVGKMEVGSKAVVKISALEGRSFEGTVTALGMTADPASRSYTAKIAIQNHDHLLRDGMVGEARIFGRTMVNLLTVPGNALLRDERGFAKVYLLNESGSKAYAHPVEAGAFLGNEVVIQSGLNASDRVIVAGQQNLQEGALVVPVGGAQ